ncbi:MAG: tetratricopeptide repeat protein, partial [Kiritimatiellae bacterium]|nr:tetratricopeptide repeat protein [Kiritimatiellia bacterium]
GPAAAMESKAIKDILENRFGKTVKIDLPKDMASKAAGTEFRLADDLFRRKDYDGAEKEYLRVLSQFPEAGELSVRAVANLLRCYVNRDDTLMAKAVADYLGERMNRISPLAAKGVLAAAQAYGEGNAEMRDWMYETYLKRCPKDAQAGTILFMMAVQAEKAGDNQRADQYYNRIITEHQDDQQYPRVLSKQAWKAYANHDYADAVNGMVSYLKETQGQPSPLRAQAMFALADCWRRKTPAEPEKAIKMFSMLISSLSGEQARAWGSSAADQAKNATLLEQANFWRAYTQSQFDDEAKRREGVKQFQEFLSKYPKSQMAPKALKAMGSAQMALKDPAANETYARLANDYPDTDEGKNAQYARISGALEIKQFDQAREAARAMVASASSFKPEEFLRVGNELLDNGLWPEAAGAFKQVTERSQDRALLERGYYGLGKALHGTGDEAGAVQAMNELMNRWPKSALFYDAKFVLAEANLKLGETEAAKDALNSIFRYADDVSVNNQASLLMAQVQKDEGDKAGAAQTYQRMEYLNLLNMPSEKERKQMKQALLEAMALEEEMQDYARLTETADAFLENFATAAEVPDVRAKRNSASLKLSMEVGGGTEGGGDGAGEGTES